MTGETLLFFEGAAEGLPIYALLEERLIAAYPDMTVKVQKTQISFYDGCGFGCVSRPRKGKGLMVTFGLPFRLQSDRVFAVSEPYPGRWTQHVLAESPEDIDGELLGWMDMAHEFALNKRRKKT